MWKVEEVGEEMSELESTMLALAIEESARVVEVGA